MAIRIERALIDEEVNKQCKIVENRIRSQYHKTFIFLGIITFISLTTAFYHYFAYKEALKNPTQTITIIKDESGRIINRIKD